MGCDKALLPFGPGEVLLQRMVRLVGEVMPAERIVCVAAVEQFLPRLPAEVRVIRDTVPNGGPLAGLVAGMVASCECNDAVFVCGCDMPRLVPAMVPRLFELLGNHQIAALHDGERLQPLVAVYQVAVLPIAKSLLEAGNAGLLSLLEHGDTLRVSREDLRHVDPDLVTLTSCNTPAEYRAALASILPPAVS